MSVIFLNGCTSAGKSSIARSLQALLPRPHLLTGIDDAFAMLPPALHNTPDGFFFDRTEAGLIRLNFGAFGLATLKAHQQSAAALAMDGMDVILDEVILSKDLWDHWQIVLADLDVFWVGVHCDLEELERREVARGDRVHGQARGQYDIVHKHATYDFTVDTTQQTSEACAGLICDALQK
ncbi:MAG: chloramphenicol phosphotransferase [Pseudomonadota bacterium]